MTSTTVIHGAPARAGTTANALLIPADPKVPVSGLTVDGPDDVREAVGGQLQGFAWPADPTVWGYARAIGTYLAAENHNARATSMLNPHGAWITGDVVLVACEDHRHRECSLPARLAALITDPKELPEPTLTYGGVTAAFYAWEISREQERTVTAILTITSVPTLHGPIGANEYTAILETRHERPDLFGAQICCHGITTAHCLLRQRGVLISRDNTSNFADRALATVNALYAVADERVGSHFQGA